jgi:predicted amidohydrolase
MSKRQLIPLALFLALVLVLCLRAVIPAATAPATRKPAVVKVAAIQFRSTFGDPADNRKRLEGYIRQAARKGAKIVVVPETAITGYTSEDLKTTWQVGTRQLNPGFTAGKDPADCADTVPGTSTEIFAKLAGELGIYLTIPFVERDGEGATAKYYNTICLADPAGKIVLHYRKLNPWPYPEDSWATKGNRGHQVIDTPYGRLALLVCYDINFEPPQLQKLNVDTLLYCIAWVDKENSTWFTKELPGIARDNNLNIIGADWTLSQKPDWFGYGHSLILTREGVALTRCKDDLTEEILYAELPVK